MSDNPDQSIRWLQWLRPKGPWTLTAIPAEGGRTTTATFHDLNAARGWIDKYNGKQNVYFALNPLRTAMDKKAKKTDVEELAFLHVDIDPKPPSNELSEDELRRWNEDELERIQQRVLDFSPSPSGVVFSGGGLQCFWRLDEPLYLGGDDNRILAAEAYNRQLEADLGGDHCHNVDRVCRLPGTINLPNEKKRRYGRVETLATIEHLGDETYPRSMFKSAPLEQQRVTAASNVELGQVPRLRSLDELPAAVTQRTRMLIVQGADPDDPTKYSSKSEAMWAVACDLVRASCDDGMIAAVLLDPGFGISDHPLRQKRSAEYVARQIERAREEVVEPMLRELNERHFAVSSMGGKFRIASWRRSELDGRELLDYQSTGDFTNRYMHRRVQVGTTKEGTPVYKPAGRWWLEHPLRRQYDTVVFAPNDEVDHTEFNLWRGLAVAAVPGEWPFLRRMIWEALAAGDDAHFSYIIRWLAFAVQHPERAAEVALVFRGGRGIGKSTLGHIMRRIFGQHGMNVTHAEHLHGRFNDHLHDCCLLFADEAVAPGDRAAEQMIKVMITEPTLLLEPKGLGKFMARNRLHVIMTSNERWVVPAGADERRFAVFDVSPHLAVPPGAAGEHENAVFWTALYQELSSGGLEAFVSHLLAIDLGDWHPRRGVPQTSGLLDQKVSSLRDFQRVWFELLSAGELPEMPSISDYGDDHIFVSTRQLWQYAKTVINKDEKVSETEIGLLFDKMKFRKMEKCRPRGYVIAPLTRARQLWDEHVFPSRWGASTTWDVDAPRDRDVDGPPY